MAKFDIIAATGCPTGIAHTFMAKEALEKAAAERGLTIKVETHGQVGVENELTKGEIAGAKAVVVAADKDVQAERFAGKPMVSVGVSKALSVEAAGKLIDRALAAKGDDTVAAAADVEDEVEEKESIGHIIYKHLMNGVSHMLVFVVAGGVLTAVSFLWGITSFDSTAADYNSFAAMLKIIGGIAMNLMVPVLSAYIAESIGKRPALVPGFVAGMIAIQGLPVNAETGMIDSGGAGVASASWAASSAASSLAMSSCCSRRFLPSCPRTWTASRLSSCTRCSRPPSSVWSCSASPAPWLPLTPP